jgi:tetratricopeptide (TPR) repeat protein
MNKIFISILIIGSVTIAHLPLSTTAYAIGAEQAEKKKRKTQLVGPSVGKKIAKAFEAYAVEAEDGSNVENALALLLDIRAKKDFDVAFLNRFIGVMYAQKGDEKNALIYLNKAVAPDILNESEQAESLKLVGDLQMQVQGYKKALAAYDTWMDFTGKSDANVWMKIAQANLELKDYAKVIPAADNAIAELGDKVNQNPYVLKLNSYYERKMFKKCVEVLETAVQVLPDVKLFWTQLGSFYAMIEDYPKSLSTMDLAYKKGFLDKESQIKMLANLYAQSEIPHKAAVLLEKHIDSGVVKRDNKNLFTLANSWHAAQHIDKAAGYYGELAKMTNLSKHYSKQGMLLNQDEQFAKAIVALKKAIELGVRNTGRLNQSIAESYFYLENYKQAYVYIKKALRDPKARRTAKGWVSFIEDTAKRKKVSI